MKLKIKESEYGLGGRNYSKGNPVLQEYLDFLREDGIEVIGVYPGTKLIKVKRKDLEMASFYLQDRDYFGKDLYRQGWSVGSSI